MDGLVFGTYMAVRLMLVCLCGLQSNRYFGAKRLRKVDAAERDPRPTPTHLGTFFVGWCCCRTLLSDFSRWKMITGHSPDQQRTENRDVLSAPLRLVRSETVRGPEHAS